MFTKMQAMKEGKMSYTPDQKSAILDSLTQTKKAFEEMIVGLDAQIEEITNAPEREHRIGDES